MLGAVYSRGSSKWFVSIVFVVLLFFTPNIALLVGGFHGFYITYVILGVLVALSISSIFMCRGLGAVDVYGSLTAALLTVSIYTLLGFLWGFGARPRLSPMSVLTSLALLLINILSVEVARGLTIGLFRGYGAKSLSGIAVGLLFGSTLPALASYIAGITSAPIPFLRDAVYSYLITLLHIYGGFPAAAVFRVVVEGYWRLSPLVLSTAALGITWPAISIAIYYGAMVYLFYAVPRLRGYSRNVFRRARASRYIDTVINIAVYTLTILLLLSLYMRVVPMVIASGSMAPTLSVGDVVLVDTRKPLNISVGDIVAFRFGNSIVVHRVVEVLENGFRTKGDANSDPDPFIVERDMVLGRVIGSIPRVGLATLVLQQGLEVLQFSLAQTIALVSASSIAAILLILVKRRRSIKKIYI